MNITKLSIERPTLLVVVFSLLIFLGLLSYNYLTYELVPKFTPPVITVTTVYPGASPEEVEENISIPLEEVLSSLQNVDQLTTTSQENFSLVRLELTPNVNVTESMQEAERKLNTVVGQLPEQAQKPVLSRFDFDDLPIMRIGSFSSLDPFEFSALMEDGVIPELYKIEGVAEIRLLGKEEQEIRVSIDPDKLDALQVSIYQVLQAIKQSNLNVPVGMIKRGDKESFIRYIGELDHPSEINNLVITERAGRLIKVGNVAEIRVDPKSQDILNRINGRPSLGLDIKKQGEANAVTISTHIREKLDELSDKYKDSGLQFEIAQDTSEFTLAAANAVISDLTLAVILVSLVMLLFLHSLRNSLIVFVSIPTSIISTFIVMYVFGYTLNLLSLLGLSLAIGILVDDSIVVIENIYRHLEMKKGKVKAAYDGRMEIGFTAISITLIDVVVFLPIVFATGIVADLLRQFSVVIVTSTLMSLVVSFTLVPLLASRFGKLERITGKTFFGKFVLKFENSIDVLISQLDQVLKWAFRHKVTTLFIALVLLAGSVSLIFFGFIGLEFTKSGDRSEFMMEIELPKGTAIQKTNEVARQVEDYVSQFKEVESVFTTVGITSSGRIEFNTSNLAEMNVKLINKKKRNFTSTEFAHKIKLDIESQIPDVKIRPVGVNILGLRDDDAVQVTITGTSRDSIESYADKVFQMLDEIPGAVEVVSSESTGLPEYRIEVDHEKAQMFDLNTAQTGGVLRLAYSGDQSSKMVYNKKDLNINIRLDEEVKNKPEKLRRISFINEKGQLIRLSQFAAIERESGFSLLERTNRAPSVTLKSQVIGKPAGTIGNELKNKLESSSQPSGIEYIFGGQTKRTTDGLRTMGIAFAISILLVYLILVALYDSYHYPFVVLFSVPLAVIGALLMLALTQQALSIFSILGMIMLVGLVGKNAILVVDFTNSLREKGRELQEALLEATRLRFRPILMTNITMIIGLLPIALASGAGSEWKNGLAWALIGGLSSSMFLTLIIVPVVYYVFERSIEKMGIVRNKKVRVE